MTITRRRPAPARGTVAALLFLLLAAAAGGGCASVGTRPEDREVVVRLQLSRSAAVRRTLDALSAQGYRVKESGLTAGTDLTTEPFDHDGVEATFRAVVEASGGSSRVTLSGSYSRRQFGGIVKTKPEPIVRSDEGVERELWARMQNLALAIRAGAR